MDHLWFVKHKNILRGIILLLLVISLLGPWFFDKINVPAKYPCFPSIRLYGDFCGSPTSGIQIFGLFIGSFFYILFEMIRGTFAGRSCELLFGLSILPLIPLFTTLLSIWKKETHRFLTINLVAWILALIPTLYIFIADFHEFQQIQHSGNVFRLWGIWLYIILAVSAIILEIIVMKISPNE